MLSKIQSAFLFALLLSLAALGYAQGGANGTILGTVTDNSGAVVANATVDVTNTATNVTNHTQTTSSGDFTVPFLSLALTRLPSKQPDFRRP
jgi:hypothetical protein